jgi:hypothetical protein
MKRLLILIILFSILLVCSHYVKFTKHIAKPNPLEYNYNFPIDDVRRVMNVRFSDYKFRAMSYFVGYNYVEQEMRKLTDTENSNHIFLNWYGVASAGQSEIYYNLWGKLDLYPCYHIILDSLSGNRTRIRIESFPKVKLGRMVDTNHGIPYLTSNRVEVKPSTIEEYEIIKIIGDDLGEKNMPVIIRPE